MGGAYRTLGEINVKKIFGEPKGRKPQERPRRRWEDNIKWILRK
jgi:hypothetical protein